MIECRLCHKFYKSVTHAHLRSKHSITIDEYLVMFPDSILSSMWGKSYEEIHGKEKAKQLRDIHSKSHIGKNTGYRVPRETRICANLECNNVFEVIITSKRRYCSAGCFKKGRTYKEIYGDRADEVAIKISKALEGHKILEETKKKISKTLEGHEVTEDAKKKMGVASKGRSSPSRNKTYKEFYGDRAESERKKRSVAQLLTYEKGRIPGMLDKQHTEKAKQKLREFFGGDRYIGEANPNWHDGISKLPYPFDFNEELKESIRERDSHTCQVCKLRQEQLDRKLSVHHIDYNKDNCDSDNLISLCRSCHAITNGDRVYWTKIFQERMKLRFCMVD